MVQAIPGALDAEKPPAHDRAGPAGADVCAGAHHPWRRGAAMHYASMYQKRKIVLIGV